MFLLNHLITFFLFLMNRNLYLSVSMDARLEIVAKSFAMVILSSLLLFSKKSIPCTPILVVSTVIF